MVSNRYRLTICRWSAGVLVMAVLGGCGSRSRAPQTQARTSRAPQEAFTVHIDQRENGAADGGAVRERDRDAAMNRTLAFRVVGQVPNAAPKGTQEERAAASQAAVIDALCKAMIEARQSRGQSTANFTAKIGPRMTFTHEGLPDGDEEITVSLISRGVETRFIVRGGELQHPPHDLRLLRQVFDETNGEFTLLETDSTSNPRVAQAVVACYLPAGLEPGIPSNLAGDPVNDDQAAETP